MKSTITFFIILFSTITALAMPPQPIPRATSAETIAQTDTRKLVTPAGLGAALNNNNATLDNTVYGLDWDESADNYTRSGTLIGITNGTSPGNDYLPIQRRMQRCVLNDSGQLQYYLLPTDGTKKWDGSSANLDGTDGQVMVQIPKFYYLYSYTGTTHSWSISLTPHPGYQPHPAFYKNGAWVDYRYIGAYEGVLEDVSASIYANGVYLASKSLSFDSETKTIAKLTGSAATVNMTGAAAGTGFAPSDVLTLDGGTVGATITVATVGGSGEVLTITLTTKGYGYTTGVKTTTGGSGSDCTINIATLETLTNGFTNLAAGDKVTISGSASNNSTFTVATTGSASFTVDESVTDEPYALTATAVTQKDFTATSGDKLSSVTGYAPITQGTRAQFRAIAANRGSGWRQLDYDLVSALQLLYLTEYASFYSQSVIGIGITAVTDWLTYSDYNPISKTGNSNAAGNATGNTAGATSCATEKTKYMSYRGIENWYGHLWKWADGININNNIPYISNNTANWADDTATNYIDLGVTLVATNGWQSTLKQISRGFLPDAVGASEVTKITDYYYQASGWRAVLVGGKADSGGSAGAFYVFTYFASGNARQHIGGRLCY